MPIVRVRRRNDWGTMGSVVTVTKTLLYDSINISFIYVAHLSLNLLRICIVYVLETYRILATHGFAIILLESWILISVFTNMEMTVV